MLAALSLYSHTNLNHLLVILLYTADFLFWKFSLKASNRKLRVKLKMSEQKSFLPPGSIQPEQTVPDRNFLF